jgi:hypothetical protein
LAVINSSNQHPRSSRPTLLWTLSKSSDPCDASRSHPHSERSMIFPRPSMEKLADQLGWNDMVLILAVLKQLRSEPATDQPLSFSDSLS